MLNRGSTLKRKWTTLRTFWIEILKRNKLLNLNEFEYEKIEGQNIYCFFISEFRSGDFSNEGKGLGNNKKGKVDSNEKFE